MFNKLERLRVWVITGHTLNLLRQALTPNLHHHRPLGLEKWSSDPGPGVTDFQDSLLVAPGRTGKKLPSFRRWAVDHTRSKLAWGATAQLGGLCVNLARGGCSVTKSCPTLVAPWTAACQAYLSSTISWNLLKFISIESVMLYNHFILCCPFPFRLQFFPASGLKRVGSCPGFCGAKWLTQRRPDFDTSIFLLGASLMSQMVKNLPTFRETQVWFLSWEDSLEKGIATHSSILAWRIPWTEEPGGLQSMRSQRVRPNWATDTHVF